MTLSRLVSSVAVVLAISSTGARAGVIYKCRNPSGRWQYSDHRPHQCRGPLIILARTPHRLVETPRPVLPNQPPHVSRAQWQATLRQLLATPVPHNPAERARRMAALAWVEHHIRVDAPRP